MRGLDFLFGHAQGYGERRVGTDVYGIPMYANKRSPTESVALLVEQPSVQRLEYHQSSDVEVHPDGLDSVSIFFIFYKLDFRPKFNVHKFKLSLSSCDFELVIQAFEVATAGFY